MQELLTNFSILANTYIFYKEVTTKDTIDQTKQKLMKVLKMVGDESVISTDLFKILGPSDSSILRLYRLSKVHKDGVSLHPLLNMSNSPYYSIPRRLVRVLQLVK